MGRVERPNAETTWIRLVSSALSTAEAAERIAQLATTRGSASDHLSGRPACRCINIRSFGNGRLYFSTDLRSGKIDDVTHSPYVELCWYIARHSLQFRFSGEHRVLQSCEQSRAYWDALSEEQRLWWAWPHPGKHWSGHDAFNVTPTKQPPDNFCVFEIIPYRVEIIDLVKAPFHREVHTLTNNQGENNGEWTIQRVNP